MRELLDPGAYPRPRPRRIDFEETHASRVFLTEHDAWKIKRPVDFGFLDYSTPAKRKRSCEEEVRLGRRLAPGIYRGVVPIRETSHGHAFVGPGAIVDHAVRMRRLAKEDSAASLLAGGHLPPLALTALAERLAAFYAKAPERPEFGAPARFADHQEENFRQARPFIGRFVPRPLLARLIRWQRQALATARPALLRRVREGRVREGHGDLRLEHVYFPGRHWDQPLVIDPIEFNASFRSGDVALDVAFLAMELTAAERDDLATHFLSCFAAATGDYGSYPLLDLFLSYRAFIRAKIACFVATGPGSSAAKAQRKRDEARRLFRLAEAVTRPRTLVPVIAVGGMIAAGKSSIAAAVGPALGAPVLSSDRTRKWLGDIAPHAPGPPRLYTAAFTRRTYATLFRDADQVLGSGRGVVLDATFIEAGHRARARALARRHGRPFLYVHVACDETTLRNRLRARERRPSLSDAREHHLERLAGKAAMPRGWPSHELVTVDGAAKLGPTVQALLRKIRRLPRASSAARSRG